MEEWKTDKICHSLSNSTPSHLSHLPCSMNGMEEKDPIIVRKVQKADREKLRRDRLNEQFIELGNTLDADRPKNDKATILTDTIQLLKDLTAEVNRLKAECAVLSEESRELTQEKNELREEKASLKSDIENLNIQYQQRQRAMFPWAPVEAPVVMGPPYSYPVPVALGPSPIPMHPSLQPYPFFGSQNPGIMANPCPAFIPYPTVPNPHVEQLQHASNKPDSKNRGSDYGKAVQVEKSDDSNDVATELELKTPGSIGQQEMSSVEKKGKQSLRKESSTTDRGSSSKYSCQGPQESSSCSVSHVPEADKGLQPRVVFTL